MSTAKRVVSCSVPCMGPICSLSKRRFPRHGTSGFATCSSECRLVTKRLPCRDGLQVRGLFVIWANGTPILKTIPILLVSIDQNGIDCQRSVETSGQCSPSSLEESPYMSNWCLVQVAARCSTPWSSEQGSVATGGRAGAGSPDRCSHYRAVDGGTGTGLALRGLGPRASVGSSLTCTTTVPDLSANGPYASTRTICA